jgi:hypothetical protein
MPKINAASATTPRTEENQGFNPTLIVTIRISFETKTTMALPFALAAAFATVGTATARVLRTSQRK